MASSLLEVSTSSKRSSKACKLDGRNGLSRPTAEVNLRLVELFRSTIAFNLPVLNVGMVLSDISTNTR